MVWLLVAWHSLLRLALASGGAAATAALAAKLYGEWAVRRHERLDLQALETPGDVTEVEGLRVHYREAGVGPPVVLVHGLGASSYAYRFMLPALAAHFRAIALDLPGFGHSSRSAPDMSLSAQARYLARFLDALGIQRASFVGHSMGGSIMARFAATNPERVDRLVLVSPADERQMYRGVSVSFLATPFVPAFAALVYHTPWARRRWLEFGVHDVSYLTPEVLQAYSLSSRVKGHNAALQRLLVDRRKDGPFDPTAIECPTLIIWGRSDRLLPLSGGERLLARLRDARLVVVEGAGHLVVEERPEDVNQEVLRFFLAGRMTGGSGLADEDAVEAGAGPRPGQSGARTA